MDYRKDETYMALERIIEDAGVTITYRVVPDDSIDGPLWARANDQFMEIQMPEDGEAFPDSVTACLILGHEFSHILTGLDSPDGDPVKRVINEGTCDIVGALLYKLAEMTAEHEAERAMLIAFAQSDEVNQ